MLRRISIYILLCCCWVKRKGLFGVNARKANGVVFTRAPSFLHREVTKACGKEGKKQKGAKERGEWFR